MRAPRSTYLLDNAGAEAPARRGALAEMFDASTKRHLPERGVGPGWRCLEVGGGNGSIAEWLADRTLPNGRVVVTDLDTRFLDRLAHPNLETRAHDITRDPLPEATFDLIHVRLVLVHLREWERVLGWSLEEARTQESVPPDPDRRPGEVLFKTQIATARLMVDHHFDRRFGRLLFGRFRDAGLIEAGVYGAPPPALSSQPEISRESSPHQRVRKIATEEAFCTPDVAAAVRDVVRRGGANLDLPLLTLIYNAPTSAESKPPDAGGSGASNRDQQALQLLPRLLDVGAMRLAEMDAHGVDMHILSLTMPGWRGMLTTASVGSYPTDLLQGLPGGRYASLTLRLPSPKRKLPPPPVPITVRPEDVPDTPVAAGVVLFSLAAGVTEREERVIRVRTSGAQRVEVMGDFSDWEPVQLRLSPTGIWEVSLRVPPGRHRFVVRVDGGDWLVPNNIVRVRDDFDGFAGAIVVP